MRFRYHLGEICLGWCQHSVGIWRLIKSVVVQNQLRFSWGARRDMVGQRNQVCDWSGSDRLLVGVSSESGPSILRILLKLGLYVDYGQELVIRINIQLLMCPVYEHKGGFYV